MNDFARYCKNRIKYGFFKFIFLGIIAIISGFILGGISLGKVYALTTETIYSDISSNCTLSNSNKYKNIASNGTLSNNSINTTYTGKSYGISFAFEEPMVNTKVYELKITFMSNDLLPKVNQNYLLLTTYNTTCDSDYATILSIEKNTNSGNATTLTISFIPEFTSSKARLIIGSDTAPVVITGETTFGIKLVQIGDRDAQGNEDIIINNNQNTQNIITNQEQNTQNIIDNQNQNTQQQIESQQVCSSIDKTNIEIDNKYLDSSGNQQTSSNYGITNYIKINSESKLSVLTSLNSEAAKYCFYNINKELISCHTISNSLVNTQLTIPDNAEFFRSSIQKVQNKPTYNLCINGNQALADTNKNIWQSILDLPSAIGEMLTGLFVPSANELTSFTDDLKIWFETKFGVLGQLVTITTDFITRFYTLSDDVDVVINIPTINVPNFEEDTPIITQTTWNWTELLESKQEFNTLWQLYLDFMDVIIIIAFLNFCYDILEGILGENHINGDQIYESEGESYSVNDKTGELTDHRFWRKRSQRI